MADKDYYKILGVDKKASDDEIKKQYRKLAAKNHPDKFANKSEAERAEAEKKMQEINEAYDVLSDKEKRAAYDNPNPFNMNGANPFADMGSRFGFGSSMFSSFFGGNSATTVQKGSNIRINLNVSLDDILNRTLKKVKYNRSEGTGNQCLHCGGTGRDVRQQGGMIFQTTCKHCGGTGREQKSVEHECTFTLDGVDDAHDVNFDPQTNTASFLTIVQGEGNKISDDPKTNGDLYVAVHFKLPDGFKMESPIDVSKNIEIPVIKAILGGEQEVVTITGSKIKARIPKGVTDGSRIRFTGKGLKSKGFFGNMIGVIKLKMPTVLSEDERRILESLASKPNFN